MNMRVMNRRLACVVLAGVCVTGIGCHANGRSRQVATAEPSLSLGEETAPPTIVEAPPARELGFADRHPLLFKPREYYETSGGGKVGKVASATVIGVPAGIIGEVKQIVVGQAAK